MEDDCGETPPNFRTTTTAYDPIEDRLCACAEACNVGREMIDIVSPAHTEQQRRMECHLETGSYMETMVFEFDQKPSHEQKWFLMIAFEAVRFKNCLLRTRLVKYKGQVLQIILSDKADWTEGDDLSAYREQDRMFRMDYGRPLFRYALLEDEDKPTYFVWTVNYSCLESWMRELVLDDLHTACWDFSHFMRRMRDQDLVLPLRPSDVYWAGHLPRRRYNTSKAINTNAPRFNPLEYTTLHGGEAFGVLHLPVQTPNPDSELSVVGHAAWALACYKDCTTAEVGFISVNPALYGHLHGSRNIMSPIVKGVQVLVPIERSKQIRELLSDLGKSSDGVIGKEHGATKAPNADILFYHMLFRGVFQWDPVGGGCLDRTFALFDRGVAPAIFRCRCAQSIPPSHDYGLLLSVQKADGLIEIYCTWDTILGKAQVEQMFERFIHFFEAIVNGWADTVGDLLPV